MRRRTRRFLPVQLSPRAPVYEPLGAYLQLVRSLRDTGFATGAETAMPPALIDITAALIATLVAVPGVLERPEDAVVFTNFVKRVLRRSDVSCSALLLAVFYLNRLRPAAPLTLSASDGTGCAEFLAAVVIADKYIDDAAYANVFWARMNGRYSLAQINSLEREFLGLLEYDLFVSDHDYDRFLSRLELHLALRQVARRRILTYADLCVILASLWVLPLPWAAPPAKDAPPPRGSDEQAPAKTVNDVAPGPRPGLGPLHALWTWLFVPVVRFITAQGTDDDAATRQLSMAVLVTRVLFRLCLAYCAALGTMYVLAQAAAAVVAQRWLAAYLSSAAACSLPQTAALALTDPDVVSACA